MHGAEESGAPADSRWQPVKRGPGGKPLDDIKTKPNKDTQKKRKKPSRKEAKRIAAVKAASEAAHARIHAQDGSAAATVELERHLHADLAYRIHEVYAAGAGPFSD